jgi:hypothetical protein
LRPTGNHKPMRINYSFILLGYYISMSSSVHYFV